MAKISIFKAIYIKAGTATRGRCVVTKGEAKSLMTSQIHLLVLFIFSVERERQILALKKGQSQEIDGQSRAAEQKPNKIGS